MSRKLVSLFVKLLLASFCVGLAMTLFGITPVHVFQWLDVTARDAVNVGTSLAHKAWAYVVIGAAIVIPVWLILMGLRYLRGRS